MMNKFKFLTKDSLKSKICTKAFLIANILLFILLVSITNLDSLIKLFGGDFNEQVNIYIVDEVGVFEEIDTMMNQSVFGLLENYNAKPMKAEKSLDELKNEIIEEESDHIILHITNVENQTVKEMFNVEFISYGTVDTTLYQSIITAINSVKTSLALNMVDIDAQMLADINSPVAINRVLLDEDADENEELTEAISTIIMLVFILPVFMLIITVVQMIGAEINEEKSSKGMEIIISSVSPKIHFIAKLVAANLFALTQGALLLVYGFIGMIIKLIITGSMNLSSSIEGLMGGSTINGESIVQLITESGIIEKMLSGLPIIILIIVLTFIAYTLFIGILASITTSMEDFNQIQTPVMVFLMTGYMLSIFASLFKGSVLLKVMAMIPFVSGILAPVMYMLGEISLLQISISILLLMLVIFILYKYGLRIYKVGILNYSSSNLWKKMFKALKTRD